MDCMSQIWSIVPCLWDCSAKHAAYIYRLQQNMETLSTEVGTLRCLHEEVKNRVEAEEARNMRRTEVVENWLERALAMVEQVIQLEPKLDEQVKKCMGISCCPRNCRSSYKLGKEVLKKLSTTRGLIEEGRAFDVETTVGLDAKFKEAWTTLQDKRVGVMGLYGTGGVGKTTLLKKINNEFLDDNADCEFDVVIWVVVSKLLDLGRVQEVIRGKLCIQDEQWNNKSEDLRAAEILKVLKTKKFVLMLDDLWEPFELSKIGVPCPNENNMCKVVFTTRSEEVCRRMNAHPFIRVDCLPPHEAFNLFCSKVGEDTLKSHRDIPDLAKAIAAECGGLPLALITTGGAMAGRRNPQEWRHAITTLQCYPARFSDMEDRVLRVLRYSYDSLEDDVQKSCFLYCSLFPEDYNINAEMLIKLWIGEGFLGEANNVGEAQAQGEYIINSLKRACLLEDGPQITLSLGSVRMHDVLRDMALWISDNKYVVQVGDTWTERNTIGRWNTAQRIALWNYNGNRLTEVPNCPNLITLLIQSTQLEELPSEFFKSMKVLRVMDLSRIERLKKLPNGIGGLINLQYLNVSYTGITELPIEVQHLKNLKVLLVSCKKLSKKVIENLSSLQVFRNTSGCESALSEKEILEGLMCLENLKDLSIKIDYASNFSVLKQSLKLQGCLRSLSLRRLPHCLTEVPNCPNLISLFIHSTELEELPHDFFDSMKVLRVLNLSDNKRLKKLSNGIGGLVNLEYLNVYGTGIDELPIEVQHLKKLKFLRMSCKKLSKKVIESLSSLQVFDNTSWCESALLEKEILEGLMCLENLKDLSMRIHHASNLSVLEESPKLQGCLTSLCLSRVEDLASFTMSRTYETLRIDECKELEEVKIEESWKMQSSNRYLSSSISLKLRHLTIEFCPKIRNLTALVYAHNLQTLEVWHCESMFEIISEEEESEVQNEDIFSSLTSLWLWDLPRLRSICPHNLLFPSLEIIKVVDCPNLKKLPLD